MTSKMSVRVHGRMEELELKGRLIGSDDPAIQAIGWGLDPVIDESVPPNVILVMHEGHEFPTAIGNLTPRPARVRIVYERAWWAPWTWFAPRCVELPLLSPPEPTQ